MNFKLFLFFILPLFSSFLSAQNTSAEIETDFSWIFRKQTISPQDVNENADSIQRMKIKTVTEKYKDRTENFVSVDHYNKKGLLVKSVNGRRDKVVDLYTYSSTGELLTDTRYYKRKLDLVDSLFYNMEGMCIEVHHHDFQQNNSGTYLINYDEAGHIVTFIYKSAGYIESYYYTYDNLGQKSSALCITCDSSGCDTSMHLLVKRDEANNIIAFDQFDKHMVSKSKDTSNEWGYEQEHCTFVYDAFGFVIKSTQISEKQKRNYIFSYDAHHHLKTEEFIEGTDTTKKTHYYSQSTRIDSIVSYRPNYADTTQSMVNIEIISYNNQGQIIADRNLYGQIGYSVVDNGGEYRIYDNEGRLLEIRNLWIDPYSDFSNVLGLSYEVEYRYNEKGLITDWNKFGEDKEENWFHRTTYTFYK